jgi:glucuronate isomerase
VSFPDTGFLLHSKTGRRLYEEYAATQPICDYHSHLDAEAIALNRGYSSITEAWLSHDHYKWRAMRANGVDERFITGDASDRDKFFAWAATVPRTLRNPLYQWTHMELKYYFGLGDMLLNESSAEEVYRHCNDCLHGDAYRPQSLLESMNVKVLCTTNDPTESLEQHLKLRESDGFSCSVLPTFRPDRALQIENPDSFKTWVLKLGDISGIEIGGFDDFLQALQKRHDAFHDAGCRASDHGLERIYAEPYTEGEVRTLFRKTLRGEVPDGVSLGKFKTCMLAHFAWMDTRRGWVQMLHVGALRNNNTRLIKKLGADSGLDSMGEGIHARTLLAYLDRLEQGNILPKTVLFNINPGDNDMVVSIAGCFQGGEMPGRIQIGPPWWFNDHGDGILSLLNAISNGGLLSTFIGMTTDSRSILSFPRHDFFRRVLCSLIGAEMERGDIPDDVELVGDMIEDICCGNAASYFGFPVPGLQA